jgi:hypothetical protein
MASVIARVRASIDAVSQRGQAWVDRQHPGTRSGVAIGAWRAYREVEGPLQSALLSLYVLVAVLPALLVLEAYLDTHPDLLVRKLVHHFHLNAQTAPLLHGVLGSAGSTSWARCCSRLRAHCSSDWGSAVCFN